MAIRAFIPEQSQGIIAQVIDIQLLVWIYRWESRNTKDLPATYTRMKS